MIKPKLYFYVLIGLLIAIFAGIGGIIYLGANKLESESATISDLQADRDIAQESIVQLRKAKQSSAEVDSVTALLDRLLPTSKEQDKLIADIIYTSTAEAGIPFSQVSTFSFSGGAGASDLSGTTPSKDHPGVIEYPFTMSIDKISYSQLLDFLKEVETNGRIIQIDNIQIQPESGILNVTLSMKAYIKQ